MDRMAEGPMEKNGWMDEGFVTLMEATKVSLLGSGVWSVECGVWSVECGVWSVECGVWSVECRWKGEIVAVQWWKRKVK